MITSAGRVGRDRVEAGQRLLPDNLQSKITCARK
jgi:hypothetical protein